MGHTSFAAPHFRYFRSHAAEQLLSHTRFGSIGRAGFLLALLLSVLSASPVLAQFGASLNGTVADSTGAVIPGAKMTLTNTGTQQTRTATSSDAGTYNFSELGPGVYDLTATAANFTTATVKGIQVGGESGRTANVTLQASGMSTTVEVNANDTSLLSTSDAAISNTLNSETLQRLPAIGGDIYELLRTAPGITGDASRSGAGTANFLPNGAGPGQSNSGIFQVENAVQISAAGQSTNANDYLIDGVSVNSLGQAGAAVVTPNQESVSQLTVISTSYSAEDGRNSGAHIKSVTKSGTNTLHGSAYFRYDDPGLNAYNKASSDPSLPQPNPVLRVNNKVRDYAGSLGGPIIKDKLFLFGSYEGFKISNNSSVNQYVETPQFDAAVAAQRGMTVSGAIVGNAGSAPRVVRVLTPSCSTYTNAGLPCTIVGNALDVGSFGSNTNGTYFFQNNCKNPTDPACKAGYAPGTGGFNTGAGLDGVPDLEYAQILDPQHSHGNQFNGRADYYFTPKDQFAASVYFTKLDQLGPSGSIGNRPQADIPIKPLNSAATLIYIHTFGPTLLNEARANFTRYYDDQIADAASAGVDFGIPYINIQNLPPGNVQYGVTQAPTSPAIFVENTYEVRDAVTKNLGSRTLKFGGELRWEQDNNNLGGNSRPVYAFQGLFNFANNAPIYEGITANPATGGPANTARYLRSETLGLFVQHDWKVTPAFTLNTGVRYEYFTPFRNKGEELNLPVLGPPGQELFTPALLPHNHFFESDYTGVTPKFGFAWVLPVNSGNTVVRGGVARAMNRLNFSILDNATEDGPGYFSYGICCGTNAADFSTPLDGGQIQYSLGTSNSPTSYPANPALKTATINGLPVNANGTPIGIEVYGAPPRVKTPYAYLYSLETQTQLKGGTVLTVGFQGSEAHHLPRLVNQNFLYSQPAGTQPFNAAYFLQADSNSNYASLNVRAERTFRHGYQYSVYYTYSKSLDQISNGFGADSLANQTNPANNSTEWGPSDYDTRHRVTFSGLWSIPGTHGDNLALKTLTNGWQVNGIFTFHTGFPFTPVVPGLASNPYVTNAATISPVRPYAYLGGFQSSCSNSNYISGNDVKNTSFILAAPAGAVYRPGIGRNSFEGPCYIDTDLSLAREQRFSVLDHRINIRFQANLFNAFNQLNLAPFQNGNAGGPAAIVGATPDTGGSTTRTDSQFGRPTAADAGRTIELFARISF